MVREELEVRLARKAIFWINLWQRSAEGTWMPLDHMHELDVWARTLR
jgi:hypothetical protein